MWTLARSPAAAAAAAVAVAVAAITVVAAVSAALGGCGGPAAQEPPASPATPVAARPAPAPAPAASLHGCSAAAAGFESGTRGIRAPESSMFEAIRARCMADAWPAAAIDCFARMSEGELGRCAGELPMHSRDRMFATLGSGGTGGSGDPGGEGPEGGGDATSSELSLAISAAKLELLHVGVPACEAFITTVRRALACAAMPVAMRVQLGVETADFWSLPSAGLPASAQQKMSDVCGKSQALLEQEVVGYGCMP